MWDRDAALQPKANAPEMPKAFPAETCRHLCFQPLRIVTAVPNHSPGARIVPFPALNVSFDPHPTRESSLTASPAIT